MARKEQSVLFIPGGGSGDVVLNWVGKPADELRFYAKAFHRAGKMLVDECGTTGAMRDFRGCPLVFLYRHSLELYLKAILIPGNMLLLLRGEAPMDMRRHLNNHRLVDMFPDFERVVNALGWHWDMEVEGLQTRAQFKGLLNELDRVDQQSVSFRYPMDKDGKASLPNHFSFSVRIFASRMDALLDVCDVAVTAVKETFNSEAEWAAEARKYELEQQAEYESWYRDEYGNNEA